MFTARFSIIHDFFYSIKYEFRGESINKLNTKHSLQLYCIQSSLPPLGAGLYFIEEHILGIVSAQPKFMPLFKDILVLVEILSPRRIPRALSKFV